MTYSFQRGRAPSSELPISGIRFDAWPEALVISTRLEASSLAEIAQRDDTVIYELHVIMEACRCCGRKRSFHGKPSRLRLCRSETSSRYPIGFGYFRSFASSRDLVKRRERKARRAHARALTHSIASYEWATPSGNTLDWPIGGGRAGRTAYRCANNVIPRGIRIARESKLASYRGVASAHFGSWRANTRDTYGKLPATVRGR